MDVLRVPSLRGRDLLSLAEVSSEEFHGLIDSGVQLKRAWKNGDRPELLKHKTIAMIFEKCRSDGAGAGPA